MRGRRHENFRIYSDQDAPMVPPESPYLYSHKRAADDIKELARQLGAVRIYLGGHDWYVNSSDFIPFTENAYDVRGGSVAYRVALWHPSLVINLFSVCTPYLQPSKVFKPLEQSIKQGKLLNFSYQLKIADGQIDHLTSRDEIKQFLNALLGGKGPKGEIGVSVQHGVHLENLPLLNPTELINESILDYYVEQYSTNGLRSACESIFHRTLWLECFLS